MHAVAADSSDNPLDPVYLPEFAATISSGMLPQPRMRELLHSVHRTVASGGQPGAADERRPTEAECAMFPLCMVVYRPASAGTRRA